MSDTLTTPSEKTTIPQPLSDAQVGNAVATKFLNEVNLTLTGKADTTPVLNAEQSAWNDLMELNGDPQQKAVLSAIAGKIESHDPSLGIVQGTVERDPNGDITGFNFTNPQQQAAYAQSLNNYMQEGHTLKEAQASDGTTFLDEDNIRGTLEIPANGLAMQSTGK